MRIVVDTNVLISGVFFGGFPRQILNAVVESRLTACARRHWGLGALGPLGPWGQAP